MNIQMLSALVIMISCDGCTTTGTNDKTTITGMYDLCSTKNKSQALLDSTPESENVVRAYGIVKAEGNAFADVLAAAVRAGREKDEGIDAAATGLANAMVGLEQNSTDTTTSSGINWNETILGIAEEALTASIEFGKYVMKTKQERRDQLAIDIEKCKWQ